MKGPHRRRAGKRAPGGQLRAQHRDEIEYIDVSPKQLVSVAASLIPFLENDDANRRPDGIEHAAPGRPLLRPTLPSGNRHGEGTARDSGAVVLCKARRRGRNSVDSERIIVRVEGGPIMRASSRAKWAPISISSPSSRDRNSRIPASTETDRQERPAGGQGRRARRRLAPTWRAGAGPQRACGVHALARPQFETPSWSARSWSRRLLYSIHIEEFEIESRDTKLGRRKITRDIPNIAESFLRNLTRAA